MASFAITASFASTGTMGEAGGGVKRKRAVGTSSIPISFSATGTMTFNASLVQYRRTVTADFSQPNGNIEIDNNQILIIRSQFWWDKNWLYRRILCVRG